MSQAQRPSGQGVVATFLPLWWTGTSSSQRSGIPQRRWSWWCPWHGRRHPAWSRPASPQEYFRHPRPSCQPRWVSKSSLRPLICQNSLLRNLSSARTDSNRFRSIDQLEFFIGQSLLLTASYETSAEVFFIGNLYPISSQSETNKARTFLTNQLAATEIRFASLLSFLLRRPLRHKLSPVVTKPSFVIIPPFFVSQRGFMKRRQSVHLSNFFSHLWHFFIEENLRLNNWLFWFSPFSAAYVFREPTFFLVPLLSKKVSGTIFWPYLFKWLWWTGSSQLCKAQAT